MFTRRPRRHSSVTQRNSAAKPRRLGFETLEPRYALVGDFQSAAHLISTQNLQGKLDTAYDSLGNLYVSGQYVNNTNFDPTYSPGSPFSDSGGAGFLAKYNTGGTLLWVHSFDGSSISEVIGLAVDSSDNVIITGRYRGTQDFDPSTGTTSLSTVDTNTDNVFVAKYSSSGALAWAVQGNTGSTAYGFDVACDSTGSVYVAGLANSDFNGVTIANTDAYVWKLSAAGSTQWTQVAGGANGVAAYSLDVNAGRIVVGGYFQGTANYGSGVSTTSQGGMTDAFVWVLDTAGTTQWAVSAGASSGMIESVDSVAIDNAGKVFALGKLDGTADMDPGTGTASLSAGNFAWQLNADGTYAGAVNVTWSSNPDAMTRGPQGDIYIAATFNGTVDVDWGTGVRNLTDTSGAGDFALLRYDPQGRLSGVAQVTKTGNDHLSAVAVTPAGQVAYLTTLYNGSSDLDPGPGSYTASAAATSSVYLTVLQEAFANVSLSALTLAENAGTSTVRVALDRTRSEDVTITLGFAGSATLNADYSTSSDSIVIPAGQTSGSITLTALNDSAHEVGETIVVNIASLYGARAGATSQATVTLADERARHLGDFVSTTQIISAGSVMETVGAYYDASGSLLIAGYAWNNANVNFTPGVTPATTATVGSIENGVIAKYHANGTLAWSHLLGGSAELSIRSAQLDSQGNLIVAGYVYGAVDFDPSAGTVTLGNSSYSSTFVAKYSTTGSLIWAVQPTDAALNVANAIALGAQDEIYVAGRSTGTFNGQAHAGVSDAYVWKLAADGTTQWTKMAGSTGTDVAYAIHVNSSGAVVVGGEFSSTVTFATGFTATSNGARDAFVWQLDSSGSTQWIATAGNSGGTERVRSLVVDNSGRISALANISGTVDMDPGTGTANVSGGPVLWRLNSNGTFFSAAQLPSAESVFLGPQGDVYVSGDVFSTNDYDLGPGSVTVSDSGGYTDYVLARYDAAGTLTGLSQWKTDVSAQSGMVLAFAPNGQLDVFMNIISSTVDLDPGAGTQLFNSAGSSNIVRVRLQEIAASVSSPTSTMAENGGTSTVRVTLDHTHSEPVTVDLSFGGTATIGVDYSASTNSLVIPAGQTSGSITLTSLDDSTYDASETIIVSITSTYGALENGTQQITATITDDDRYIINGNSLTILGTSGNDNLGLVRVGPNSFYTAFNGELVTFYNTTINHVVVNGQGGWDYFGILGTAGIVEIVTLGPQSFSYASPGLNVLSNSEQNVAFGQSTDTATYSDSAASDIIYMLPAYSIMYSIPSIAYISWSVGFGNTTAYAGAGNDTLLFFGTIGPQTTFMTPTQTTLTAGSATITANNFESQFSYGQSDDTASLTDSSGNDTYFRLPAYGVLSTSSGIQEPIGFGTVNVTSSGGQDSAVLYESSGVDAYTGNTTQAVFQTVLETTTLNNFRSIYVNGSANDTVTLNDSSGNDIFYGGDSQSTLIYAGGRSHQVLGTQSITLSGVNGGIDTAFLDDSSGDDTLESTTQVFLQLRYANNRRISVAAFDAVYARGTNGGRNTRTADTLAFPGINFTGTWV